MPSTQLNRYVPLAAWIIVVLTLLCIPSKIISYGYLPADDAIRHAAKAVSGKPWQDILVMRPDFKIDPHPGWHFVLHKIYQVTNCSCRSGCPMALRRLVFRLLARLQFSRFRPHRPSNPISLSIHPPSFRRLWRLPFGPPISHRTASLRWRPANGPLPRSHLALA